MRKRKPEELKDSGIEWLGDIPEDWGIAKLKFLSNVKRGASPRPIDDPKYFDKEGEYSWVRISDVTASNDYLYSTEQTLSTLGASKSVKLEPGELILSIAASVGKPIINNIKCCIHDGFIYFDNLKLDTKFAFYLFKSGEPYKGLGKLGTQLNLNSESVGSIISSVPKEEEQKAIATFLDHKTQAIDQLIEKKQQLIVKLKEKRQALITKAVTKGLNPDAPMKDSGIEWLGEIPEHWTATKTKFVTNKIIDGTHHTPTYTDEGVPFLRVTDIHNEDIDLNEVKRISLEEHKELKRRCHPEKGDMLLSKNGTIGITKVINWDWEFSVFVSLSLLKFKKDKILPAYYAYFFKSDIVDEQVTSGSKKTSVTNLHLDKIKELLVTLPPISEQQQIVDYMKRLHNDYQNAIKKAELSIEKLKEYRRSLISAAVTGKIDIRDEVTV